MRQISALWIKQKIPVKAKKEETQAIKKINRQCVLVYCVTMYELRGDGGEKHKIG